MNEMNNIELTVKILTGGSFPLSLPKNTTIKKIRELAKKHFHFNSPCFLLHASLNEIGKSLRNANPRISDENTLEDLNKEISNFMEPKNEQIKVKLFLIKESGNTECIKPTKRQNTQKIPFPFLTQIFTTERATKKTLEKSVLIFSKMIKQFQHDKNEDPQSAFKNFFNQ